MVSGSVTKLADGGKAGDAMICFSFFLNLKQPGRNFPPFQKKEADEEMMIEIEDVMMKHNFFGGGLFGEADFFLHFYKKVEFLILQPMFL